ncbi:unnamed protein product [Ixodes hexagonus]
MNGHCWRFGLALSLALVVFAEARRGKQGIRGGIDPDCFRNVSSLIADEGYPVEEYNVTTSDGYILAVQRIPAGRKYASSIRGTPKKVVFLQHGLLGSSADWVLNYPQQSLGFILADAGYDVWLGNVRGNTYSGHVKYGRRSKEFWDFSLDEMIQYDLPEMLNFVLNRTKREKLFYVGHSQGNMIMFGLLSQHPEYSKKIELLCALGPVTTIAHTRSPIRFLAPFVEDIGALFYLLGEYEFLPNNMLVKLLADTLCRYKGSRQMCENVIFFICGPETKGLNVTRLPVYLCHVPAGTSVRTMVHYAQFILSKRFQKFDFGKSKNQLIYGVSTPPEYNVSRTAAPVALFWSEGDWLTVPKDVSLLRGRLPNVVLDYKVLDPEFSHLDFSVGIHAKKLVYQPMMKLMAGYNDTRVRLSKEGLANLSVQFYCTTVTYLLEVAHLSVTLSNYKTVDPDTNRNVSQIIADKGYPVEEFEVVTSDGFVLGLQRIPSGKRHHSGRYFGTKKTVFLQHGLLGSSADWVVNYPSQSLAYLLADAGYDVWLGNVRGNTYSRHLKYTRKQKEFWDFSFDQMIKYDLPAMLDFVLSHTAEKEIFYVGHSQGTLMLFGLLSEQPEYSKKIKLFSALGPVTTVGYMTSPVRYLAPFAEDTRVLFRFFGEYDFLPSNWFIRLLAKTMCRYTISREICENAIFIICGNEIKEMNLTRLPVFISHTPAGTSVKNMVHFAQMVLHKRFQKYDYGSEKNRMVYGQVTPPEYNVSRVAVPVALYWSLNDWFADPTDVALLSKRLPNLVLDLRISDPLFTHLDFIIGTQAKALVYDPMMQLMFHYDRPLPSYIF